MNETLVQDSENNVNSENGGDEQNQDRRLRILKGLRGALKAGVDGRRHMKLRLNGLDFLDGVAEGQRWIEIKRKSDRGDEALMVDGERCARGLVVRESAERNDFAAAGRQVNVIQAVRALRVLRQDVENDVILIEAFVDIGDLALAEGIGERVVNILKRDAET